MPPLSLCYEVGGDVAAGDVWKGLPPVEGSRATACMVAVGMEGERRPRCR